MTNAFLVKKVEPVSVVNMLFYKEQTATFASFQEVCKIDLASRSVQESKKFQKVLEVLLAIGNAMNAPKKRPLVYGFKLSTLSRVCFASLHINARLRAHNF